MEHLEKVEKLRERANVSYEEAKKALEECDWDMLDALVKLESVGKVKPETAEFSTGNQQDTQEAPNCQELVPTVQHNSSGSQNNGNHANSVFAKLGRAIKYLVTKGCENSLVVKHHGQQVMEIPVIAFIVLLICFFWVVVPALLVGLFFDFSYNFSGAELGKEKVNNAMDKATQMAKDFKTEINKEDNKK